MTATRTARDHALRWALACAAVLAVGGTIAGCSTVGSGGVGSGGGFNGLDIQFSGDSQADVASETSDDALGSDPLGSDTLGSDTLGTDALATDTTTLDADAAALDADAAIPDIGTSDSSDGDDSEHSGDTNGDPETIHIVDVTAPGDSSGATDTISDVSADGDAIDGGLGDDATLGVDIDSGGLGISDGANTDGDGAAGDANAGADANADANADADADTTPAGPPPAVPLSSCKGANGSKTCSVDGKLRLECILGAWTPLAHCGFGVCTATSQASGPALLSCSVPPSGHAELAAACARTISCFAPSQSLERCMRAALSPSLEAADAGTGALVDPIFATFASLVPALACISTSKTCGALAQCVHLFTQPKCSSGAQSGCDGNLAWHCSAGAALAGDCAKIGVNCAIVAGQPRCLADAPCPIGDLSTCAGRLGTVCLQTSVGKRAAKIDCGALGLQCAAGGGTTTNPAAGCGAASACPAAGAGIPACEGAKLATCSANKLVETTCPAQSMCLLQDDFGLLAPACAPNSNCEAALCGQGGSCSHESRCEGAEVWFCEQGQPRSFDCATIGKTCVGGSSPRCS